MPDALLAETPDDPAAVAAARAGTRLALVAALQYLPARQRAVLILRDVLDWPAAEVADLLGTSTTAVNSGLRRARALVARALPDQDEVAEPAGDRSGRCWTASPRRSRTLTWPRWPRLLRDDVVLEMPPLLPGSPAALRF